MNLSPLSGGKHDDVCSELNLSSPLADAAGGVPGVSRSADARICAITHCTEGSKTGGLGQSLLRLLLATLD